MGGVVVLDEVTRGAPSTEKSSAHPTFVK